MTMKKKKFQKSLICLTFKYSKVEVRCQCAKVFTTLTFLVTDFWKIDLKTTQNLLQS